MIPGSAATIDDPKPRPTPDDITKRAEEYERTRDPRIIQEFQGPDRFEFLRECLILRQRAERHACEVAYRRVMREGTVAS